MSYFTMSWELYWGAKKNSIVFLKLTSLWNYSHYHYYHFVSDRSHNVIFHNVTGILLRCKKNSIVFLKLTSLWTYSHYHYYHCYSVPIIIIIVSIIIIIALSNCSLSSNNQSTIIGCCRYELVNVLFWLLNVGRMLVCSGCTWAYFCWVQICPCEREGSLGLCGRSGACTGGWERPWLPNKWLRRLLIFR